MTDRSIQRPARSGAVLRTSVLLAVLIAVGSSGCARFGKMFKDEDADEGQPVEAIYEKASRSMKNGNWSGAEQSFKRLVAQYPYGPYTEQALIETAYAQYKAGKHEEAISSIDRFIRTYPTHRNIAYLYYLRGLVNSTRDAVFLQKVWSLDASRRDLATPMQAYNDFTIVTERYPNSRYAADARERMAKLRNMFARHELETALYYLRRDAYVAAAERARYLLDTYPQSEHQADAVATLAAAYTGLGNEALATSARNQLQQLAPNHPYLAGDWPDYPSNLRKLNPFAGEKSALDND
ncbi:outer membrane protein assembly factor BamD [Lysobacter korlensis]|uniref:Outer membrane protein assembly factor BamD n=1 Tax=Lysobacter korlensis TaxID=553636 RepID=A0ABV6RSB9_9GAMM